MILFVFFMYFLNVVKKASGIIENIFSVFLLCMFYVVKKEVSDIFDSTILSVFLYISSM